MATKSNKIDLWNIGLDAALAYIREGNEKEVQRALKKFKLEGRDRAAYTLAYALGIHAVELIGLASLEETYRANEERLKAMLLASKSTRYAQIYKEDIHGN
jgi:hypothetical protein